MKILRRNPRGASWPKSLLERGTVTSYLILDSDWKRQGSKETHNLLWQIILPYARHRLKDIALLVARALGQMFEEFSCFFSFSL